MTKRVIRQIEPTDGGKPLQLLEGRYGPYVTDGETNASVPNGTDPAALSLEDARALIDARRGAPPRANRRGRAGARVSRPRRGTGRTSEAAAGVATVARISAKRKSTKRKSAH